MNADEDDLVEIIDIIKKEDYTEDDLMILEGLFKLINEKYVNAYAELTNLGANLLVLEVHKFAFKVLAYKAAYHYEGYELADKISKIGIDKLFKLAPNLLYLDAKDIKKVLNKKGII